MDRLRKTERVTWTDYVAMLAGEDRNRSLGNDQSGSGSIFVLILTAAPFPAHITVEEGNFVLEYNFVQKKVFLCELLLPYLSLWGVKTIF